MKFNRIYVKIFSVLIAMVLFAISGCEDNPTEPEPETPSRGAIISSNTIIVMTPSAVEAILTTWIDPLPVDPTYTVNAVKIVYWTVDNGGQLVEASGALYVPVGAGDSPILSLHHGTVTARDEVASDWPTSSLEGIVGLYTTSAIGYLTCIPDYLGYGESTVLHPYVHAGLSSSAVIDFLRASRTYLNESNITSGPYLFLGGYSEGGYVTLATQRDMELNYSDEFDITAVAPMAGPYDLATTVETVIQYTTYEYPTYMAFLFLSYDTIYGWNRLSDVINDPYAGMLPGLFDGTHSLSEINGQLPTDVSQLINQDFVSDYLAGNEPEIEAAFEENTLLDWAPVAPIRFYHGDADVTVPYQNSVTARDSLTANGGANIELVTVPGGTHVTTAPLVILDAIDWFEGFRITPVQ
jgi:pimeloyl-ACP methyl ester carboxylesterase